MEPPCHPLVVLILRPVKDRRVLGFGNPPEPLILHHSRGWDRLAVLDSFFRTRRPASMVLTRWTDAMVCVEIKDPGAWVPPPEAAWYHPSEVVGSKEGLVPSLGNTRTWAWLLPQPKLSVLYHGTTRSAAESILKSGFRLPTCSHGDLPCCCGMMGQAVYLALYSKAQEYALRTVDFKPRTDGVVLRCLVDMTRVVIRRGRPVCGCGCKQPFVDHLGAWYSEVSPPSGIWLKAGSKPAAGRPELAVRDLSIITPMEIIVPAPTSPPDFLPTAQPKRRINVRR